MLKAPKALTGKRVFRMGSHAPNRGQVNPTGYLQRELKRQAKTPGNGIHGGVSKVGRDGQSDTRSGLAHQMLQGAGRVSPTGTRPVIPGVHTPQAPGAQPEQGALQSNLGPATGQVNISPEGMLNLPFDNPSYQAIVDRKNRLNQDLLGIQKTRQQQALDYLRGVKNTETEFGQVKQDNLNDYSGRGAAFSSGYGKTVGDTANRFNTMLSDLHSQNAYADTEATNQRNALASEFNQFLQQNAVDQASNLHGKAGTLGLGQTPKPVVTPKAKPKNPGAKFAKGSKSSHAKAASNTMKKNRKKGDK